jgi:hypothetical protein
VGPGIGPHQDGFVAKVNPAGSGLVYGPSRIGGTLNDYVYGLAIDSSGNAYVTGATTSDDFPTVNAFQETLAGFRDAFVAKLNPAGSTPPVYSSYLGGTQSDEGYAIAVDSNGNVYLTGYTFSSDFPTSGPLQAANGGANGRSAQQIVVPGDAFITKASAGGPTAVNVRAFTAVRSAQGIVLRWRTASEASLLGFNVWREQGGRRERLNRKLIAAGQAAYSFRDRLRAGAHGHRYLLEEVRLDGTQAWYGPVLAM